MKLTFLYFTGIKYKSEGDSDVEIYMVKPRATTKKITKRVKNN